MLTIYLVSVYVLISFSIVLRRILKGREQAKKSNYIKIWDYNKDTENMGSWNLLKTVALMVCSTQKHATHHDTAFAKLYEHFKNTSTITSKLKSKFLGTSIVFANSEKSIRQYLCHEDCSNRLPDKLVRSMYPDGDGGILLDHSAVAWKELRKYTVKTLGKLGFGKNSTMSVILDDTATDVLERMENLRKAEGNQIPVHELFSLPVINIVWVIIGGKKFQQNDKRFLKLHMYIRQAVRESVMNLIVTTIFPKFVLNILRCLGVNCQSIIEISKNARALFLEYINEVEMVRQEKGATKEIDENFVNHFLSKVEQHKDDRQLQKIYSKSQLSTILADFFTAGIDTTTKFMESCMMYMVMYPEVQQLLHNEIDKVLGNSSPSYTAHIKAMPYTQAVIMEIHRMVNIASILPRSVTRDCKIGNDILKKNTLVAILQPLMNMDNNYWEDAKQFKPERFLDEHNNIIAEKVNYMMPFGAGIRQCPGENVAKASIFILMLRILQRYRLTKGDKDEWIGISKAMRITSGPEPFHISLHLR